MVDGCGWSTNDKPHTQRSQRINIFLSPGSMAKTPMKKHYNNKNISNPLHVHIDELYAGTYVFQYSNLML